LDVSRQRVDGIFLQVLVRVCVPLGDLDRAVPQKFLDRDQVRPVLDQARGKRVPYVMEPQVRNSGLPEGRGPSQSCTDKEQSCTASREGSQIVDGRMSLKSYRARSVNTFIKID